MVLKGYSQGTQKEFSKGTQEALKGHSKGTQRVLKNGYLKGTHRVLKAAAKLLRLLAAVFVGYRWAALGSVVPTSMARVVWLCTTGYSRGTPLRGTLGELHCTTFRVLTRYCAPRRPRGTPLGACGTLCGTQRAVHGSVRHPAYWSVLHGIVEYSHGTPTALRTTPRARYSFGCFSQSLWDAAGSARQCWAHRRMVLCGMALSCAHGVLLGYFRALPPALAGFAPNT
jgi:hypothetical protein